MLERRLLAVHIVRRKITKRRQRDDAANTQALVDFANRMNTSAGRKHRARLVVRRPKHKGASRKVGRAHVQVALAKSRKRFGGQGLLEVAFSRPSLVRTVARSLVFECSPSTIRRKTAAASVW